MDNPDNTRNKTDFAERFQSSPWEPTTKTISHEKASTTTVLIAVATVESVFLIPHFARIEVSPAKRADAKAKKIHIQNISKTIYSASSDKVFPVTR